MKFIQLLLCMLAFCDYSFCRQISIIGAGKEVDPYHYTSLKSGIFSKASVATAHPLASEVGAAVMRHGGNAFDAAIAVQLALAVVYPGAGNIGGGGFLTGRKSNGELLAIDFRETAPGAASKNMYLDSAGNPQDDLSRNGRLSAGVPGTVAGLFATLPSAKLPFKMLIQPAIDLAEKGFVITAAEAEALNTARKDFIKYSSKPSAFVKNTSWKGGDTLLQPELAETLKRIRDNGSKGFYTGPTAKLVVEEMQRGNGLITLEDLKNYTAKKRKPIKFNYEGFDIISFPPPSSGGILLAQMLKMIEKYPLNSYGFDSVKAVQLMVEAERRAYADRAEHMGDPDFWKVPQQTLISRSYLEARMKDYDSTHASKSENVHAGLIYESKETTHISIIDAEGNMASITTTLNNSFGSKTVVGGAGFILNDEMDDFSAKPGEPNMYGAVGGAANAIAPHKRMLSSMTPTLVIKNNKPIMVVGTPGGTTIPTSVFQTIVDIIDFGMSANDAVNKPKFHHQWLPDEVMVEKDFPQKIKELLEKMGYTVTNIGNIGRTELVLIQKDGRREVVADNRGDDSVAGY